MNISDTSFSMACSYHTDKDGLHFVMFFQDQANVKGFQTSQVLRVIQKGDTGSAFQLCRGLIETTGEVFCEL